MLTNAKKNHKNIKEFARRIDFLLENQNLTQKKLAEILGFSKSYPTELKKGKFSGGRDFWDAIRREFPLWEDYLRKRTDIPPTELKDLKQDPKTHVSEAWVRLIIMTGLKIEPHETWEEKIASFFGLDLIDIMQSVEMNYIAEEVIKTIVAKGFAPEKWISTAATKTKSVELSFKKLSILMKIPIKQGWLNQLSNQINFCDPSAIATAVLQNNVSAELVEHIELKGYPADEWLNQKEANDSTTTDLFQILSLCNQILLSRTKYSDLLKDYILALANALNLDNKKEVNFQK